MTSVKTTLTQRRSRVHRNERVEIGAQSEIDRTDQEKVEPQSRKRDEQVEDRNQERFGEVMLYSEKHPQEGKAQGQVSTKASLCEAHHEEVQDCDLRGQRHFERNTDLIEMKNLENYTRQVAQDLYNGEARHELRGAHEEQHCRSLHETSEWIENAVARKETWTSNPGWYDW